MTEAERLLWWALRHNSFGTRFRRQVPVGPYVVDFASLRPRLVIEVDGSQHLESERDAERDRYLVGLGCRVLRFWNPEVLGDLDTVIEAIGATLDDLRGPGV
jgi:very-short-patch-repair endonuclease